MHCFFPEGEESLDKMQGINSIDFELIPHDLGGRLESWRNKTHEPGVGNRMSTLVMWCFLWSSLKVVVGSVSIVESILTIISLESFPTTTEERSLVDLATSRAAAMTVVLGWAI